ncbi:hypothetical protein COLO4_08804 [Corchorus olitorius]|uniref:Uncharacterized protein n=1 Tax=Corchorus olitorius TaxID=93759 RepID=A0A1R3KEJ7_9ROSI|nr:hypothetical protein COLO4_08804 [Corchorus olitorius]
MGREQGRGKGRRVERFHESSRMNRGDSFFWKRGRHRGIRRERQSKGFSLREVAPVASSFGDASSVELMALLDYTILLIPMLLFGDWNVVDFVGTEFLNIAWHYEVNGSLDGPTAEDRLGWPEHNKRHCFTMAIGYNNFDVNAANI